MDLNTIVAEMLDDPGCRDLEFGFNFHLCAFQRIVVTSERVPFDAIGIRRMWTIKICAIKIRRMASIVPPGSFVPPWAGAGTKVIVVIFRRKLHTTRRKMTDCFFVVSGTAHTRFALVGHYLSCTCVLSGVPLGDVLAPILYISWKLHLKKCYITKQSLSQTLRYLNLIQISNPFIT